MSIGWALGRREKDREPIMLRKGTEHVPIVFVFGKTTYVYMYHTYPQHNFLTMDPLSPSTSPMNASSHGITPSIGPHEKSRHDTP